MTTVHDYAGMLKAVQAISPAAHIAGGAVRDTLLEQPIADIDMFISDSDVDAAAVLLRQEFSYVKVGDWKQYLGFSDPAMTRVAKFERADSNLPVCIIGLQAAYAPWKENVARFDFGTCMTAYDGQRIFRTPEFDFDAETKTFTLHRADNEAQFAYSMSRYDKITAGRYAGWGLRIPSEFETYARDRAFRQRYYEDPDFKGFHMRESLLRPKAR